MRLIYFLLAIFLVPPTAIFAGQYDDIPLDKIMSPMQQKQIGINRLTPEEKENLRIYAIDLFVKGFEAGKTEGAKSVTYSNSAPSAIESQIDGEFEGWEGETVVKLINGQIWQQSEYYYTYHYAYMPKVLIYKSGSGYKMQVEGVNKPIGVVQLR